MLINFILIQFVPGGPIEQIIAQMEDGTAGATDRFTGSGDDLNNQSENNEYKGARGLPPELIEDLEKQFGFDKPPVERFLAMLWNYIRFDFGESYFRSITIIDLNSGKDAGIYNIRIMVHLIGIHCINTLRYSQSD